MKAFLFLSEIYNGLQGEILEEVVLDFSKVNWIDAHMNAPFAGILNLLMNKSLLTFRLENLEEKVRSILLKNGFLIYINGGTPERDTYNTTIPFKIYKPQELKLFSKHVDEQVICHRSFPNNIKGLDEIILGSTAEIFDNAVVHSESNEGVFVCGHLYPNKTSFDYIITDTGIGFKNNILKRRGLNFKSDCDYIDWAIRDNNSTKKPDDISSGLGLKRIIDSFNEIN